MVSDSISTAPIPSAASTKNMGKKKRTNRSAKLKQCKIDARREQWLSQGAVRNKGCNDDGTHVPSLPAVKGNKGLLEKLGMSRGEQENKRVIGHDNYSESPANSPTSVKSCNDSGTNFTGSCSSGSNSTSSTSSAGCCSGNITEEEGGDDGCLDDWEAVADALAADEKRQNPCLDSPPEAEPVVQMVSPCELTDSLNAGPQDCTPDSAGLVSCASVNSRAWRPDDASRPQCLPNLSRQHSLPNPARRYGEGVPWACTAAPSACPICCEDLDLTDSSFLPCLCGFRLCLFCHKRILEEDGRCPGCRKPYECEPVETEASVHGGSLTLRLARSCSMIERSQDTRSK